MSTLGEDILALQKRLLEETGLEFDLHLMAIEDGQTISAEQAMRAGEILTEVLGNPAKVQESISWAWLLIDSERAKATIQCRELMGKADA